MVKNATKTRVSTDMIIRAGAEVGLTYVKPECRIASPEEIELEREANLKQLRNEFASDSDNKLVSNNRSRREMR